MRNQGTGMQIAVACDIASLPSLLPSLPPPLLTLKVLVTPTCRKRQSKSTVSSSRGSKPPTPIKVGGKRLRGGEGTEGGREGWKR